MIATEAKMETSTEAPLSAAAELDQRHKSTRNTVVALLIGVILLSVLAYVSQRFLTPQDNGSLDIIVRITILIFGLGAVALRRTKFSAMRLQDIAGLKGPTGLLITLQRTTLQVALLGVVIAVVGFVATLMTGNARYAYGGSLVGVAVLLYCYPTRLAWERALQRFSPQ